MLPRTPQNRTEIVIVIETLVEAVTRIACAARALKSDRAAVHQKNGLPDGAGGDTAPRYFVVSANTPSQLSGGGVSRKAAIRAV